MTTKAKTPKARIAVERVQVLGSNQKNLIFSGHPQCVRLRDKLT